MGRATIISESGAGLYTVQPVIDTGLASAQIETLETQNTTIAARLTEYETEIATAEDNLADLLTALQVAIAAGEDGTTEQAAYLQSALELSNLEEVQSFLTLKQTANTKRIEWLTEQMDNPDEVSAWCADLTEGVTGTVGTIELGRLPDTLIIKPGAPTYVAADDGTLQPVALNSAAATFYNLAMLPGLAKWKPRYRTGTASNIDTDADTMDVALNDLTIASQSCNQSSVLTGVAVEYMTCNASAFAAGDSVIVEFEGSDWSAPKVVGFVDNPQACVTRELWIKLSINGYDCALGGEQIALRYTDVDGNAVTSDIQSIPEVGAPLDVDSSIAVSANNLSLAGPFNLLDWDEVSDIEVVLYAAISDANRQTYLSSGAYNDGTYQAAARDKLFTYFCEDSSSTSRYISCEYGWWDKLGSQIGDASKVCCGGAFGFQLVTDVSGDEFAVGYESGWYTDYGDGRIKKYKVLGAVSQLTEIVAATLTAATVSAALASATTISPMNLASGRVVSGRYQLAVAADETLKLLNASVPAKHNYRHNSKRTWTVVYPDEEHEFDPDYYSFTIPDENPLDYLLALNSEAAVEDYTENMIFDSTNECWTTIDNSGTINWQPDAMDEPFTPGVVFDLVIGVLSYEEGATIQVYEHAQADIFNLNTIRSLSPEPVAASGDTITIPCMIPSEVSTSGDLADDFGFAGQDMTLTVKLTGVISVTYIAMNMRSGEFIETGIPCSCLFTKAQIQTTTQSWTNDDVIAEPKTNDFGELDYPPEWAYFANGKIDRRIMWGEASAQADGPRSWPQTTPTPCDSSTLLSSMPLIIADSTTGAVASGGGSSSVSETHPAVSVTVGSEAAGTDRTFSVASMSQTLTQAFTLIDAPEDWL
jgi:hypothetical protein